MTGLWVLIIGVTVLWLVRWAHTRWWQRYFEKKLREHRERHGGQG